VIYTHVAAALIGAVIAAAGAWQVQDWRYNARLAVIRQTHAVSLQEAEAAARRMEQRMQTQVERIADEADKKQAELVVRAAAAERVARGLRDEITRLNARPTPAGSEAAAFAGEASVARQLLGACAEEYRGVAQEADGLRDQVIRLQQYAESVCQSGWRP